MFPVTPFCRSWLLFVWLIASSASAWASLYQSGGAWAGAGITAEELTRGYRQGRVLAMERVEQPTARRSDQITAAEGRVGIRERHRFSHLPRHVVLDFDPARSVKEVIRELQASGAYEVVEPDYLRYALATPNDPNYTNGNLWGLNNTGQSGGKAGADIRAANGWAIRTDASQVIVAVVDSGMNLAHEDLAANLWVNPRPNRTWNDRHGINARVSSGAERGDPSDDSGHGTHVAGTIGAVGNNGRGVTGVAWNVKLMPLKFLPEDGVGSSAHAVECINYAIANGASIINGSYGSDRSSTAELNAIRAARDAGIIFVAAAGNDGHDSDEGRDFPASYPLANIVSVAALARTDTLASFSNYGSGSVELAAPGESIYSTLHTSNTAYGYKNGTSMAAPHVSGALALLRAQYPNDTYRQLINRLLRSVEPIAALNGRVQTGGRLNLARALASTDTRPFNDDFATRARVTGTSVRIRSDNRGGTREDGEPAHAGQSGSASLWWEWTAPTSGTTVFDTTDSDYDTLLAIYTGTSLGELVPVAANDNRPGGGTTSRLTYTVTAGTRYQIAVDGKGTDTGFTMLRIGTVPANDTFAAAAAVDGRSFRIDASTRHASRESGEPVHADAGGHRSLWYRWTAPAAGRYQLAAFATAIDTVAAVYTGTRVDALTRIAANDDASTDNTDALATFNATAGTTYYFAVAEADANSEGGAFILTLNPSLWQAPATDEITGTPAVAPDGTVYVGAKDGYLYAFGTDGSRQWRYSVGTDVDIDTAAPLVGADGTIYVGATDTGFHAVTSAGTRRWRFTAANPLQGSAALAEDGTLYLRDTDQLYALDRDGREKWRFTLSGNTYSSPVVGTDGTIYIGAANGRFTALTPAGAVKWTFTAAGDIYSSPAIGADGTIYLATLTGGRLYALRPDGTQRWSTVVGSGRDLSSSPVLGPDGTLYIASYDSRLYAISSTGVTRWSYLMGDETRASSPAVDANGTIYIGSYDGSVHLVSSTGNRLGTYPTAARIRSSMTLADGRLYFGSQDAKLYAFAAAAPAASAWPQFQRDARKTGRSSAATTPPPEPPAPPPPAPPPPTNPTVSDGTERVINLSTRAHVGTGEAVLIGGLSIDGGPRRVLIRAVGPALSDFGVPSPLANPRLDLFHSNATQPFASNDDWGGDVAIAAAAEATGAFPFAPGSRDAALLITLQPGNYTAQVSAASGAAGQALIEFYEVDRTGGARFRNLSTRASVSDSRLAIAGFVVSGASQRVLIRVAGPALSAYGVTNPAADPNLTLYNSANQPIDSNDNWTSDARTAGAFDFTPGSKDAALLVTLPPGRYTVHAANAVAATGIVLLEVYMLDP